MVKKRTLALALALGLAASIAPNRAEDSEEKKPDVFGLRALQERFEANAPAIGERVPNVTIYNAAGESVRFRSLVRDKYSVVVFGCLT
jgi:hypothetical protein